MVIMVTFFLIFPTLQDPTLKAKGVELPANLARVRIIAVLADVAFHPSLIRFGNAQKKTGHGLMIVKDLAIEWDACEEVRDRLREGGPLLHPETGAGEDIKSCTLNKDLLAPMLLRMVKSPKKGHPPIDDLREEIATLMKKCKRVPEPGFEDLQKLAWRLRHLVCFVKSKARRKEPSTDLLLHL